jgi:peptide/nickel transport system ATP-binding protein
MPALPQVPTNNTAGDISLTAPLLKIDDATVTYGKGLFSSKPAFVALDSFHIEIPDAPASITTIAGESGSGKTTLANLILGFTLPSAGRVIYKGKDISRLKGQDQLAYRREVQAIFQDPYDVFNPFYRVQHTFDLVARRFRLTRNRAEKVELIEEALNVVGLRGAEILEKYPHQLSGGQRQRVMVARAYMLRPGLIVADEPVSAVDASLRALILDIMVRLRDEHGISFLYITHDLSTAYQIGDNMLVLYQGMTVERGDTRAIIDAPKHPYVQELIRSIPVPDPAVRWDVDTGLSTQDEDEQDSVPGCPFYQRCPDRMQRCAEERPGLFPIDGDRSAACFLYE